MTAQLPTLLALAGVALLALAIFAPRRATVQTAPPSKPAPPAVPAPPVDRAAARPQWPQLIEPSADDCDVPTRLDMVDALGALDSAWAREMLLSALSDETDPAVRERIAAALHASAPA